MESAEFRYLWNLSTLEFPVGLYPDVVISVHRNLFESCLIPLDTNSLPLSDTILSGTDFSHIHLSCIAVAITVLDRSLIGTATGHRVKVSIIVRIHAFPFSDLGNGPKMSIAITSLGKLANAGSVMPARIGRGVFRFLYARHAF